MQSPISDPAGRSRFGPYQLAIFAICFLIVLIDGFDTQAAAFAAPLLLQELTGGHGALGLVLSAGLFGSLLGGLALGPVGDRVGRKPLLAASLLIVGLGSFATAFTHGAQQLAALRFITGIGLGGAIPGVIALAAEYAPKPRRAFVVALIFSGFPLGAVAGSILSALVLPTLGWRTVFLVGGLAPLLLLPVLLSFVPESIEILRRRADGERRVASILEKLGPIGRAGLGGGETEAKRSRNAISNLFAEGRGPGTLLLWLICFLSLLCTYCIVSWLPTLVKEAGLPIQVAVLASGSINVGSVIGNVILARIGESTSPIVPLAAAYLLGGVFVGLIGSATGSSAAMLATCFAAGMLTVGAQLTLTGLIATFYPLRLRATGVGWSFGIGRFGGVVGPSAAGALLAADLGFERLMFLVGGFSVLAAVAVLLLAPAQRLAGRAAEPTGAGAPS